MDLAIFQYLNALVGRSDILDYAFLFFAEYSQYLWVILLAGLFDFPSIRLEEHRKLVTLALVAALSARFGSKTLIELFYEKLRPFEAHSGVHLIVPLVQGSGSSFPSGHALFFFAIATIVFSFDTRWGLIAFIAAALMGVSRIIVGFHYPSDVIAGALIGCLCALATLYLYKRFFRQAPYLHTGEGTQSTL